jgi:hypothetical protein
MARNDIYDGTLKDCILTGRVKYGQNKQLVAGAISLETKTSVLTSAAAAQAMTLADGTEGQTKTLIFDSDGGTATNTLLITPVNFGGADSASITLTNPGDSCTFEFHLGSWWLTAVVANTEGTPLVIA